MRWAKVHALSTRGETSRQGFVSHFENGLSRLAARPLRPFNNAHAATLDHICKLIPCDVRLKPLWFQKKGLLQKSRVEIYKHQGKYRLFMKFCQH